MHRLSIVCILPLLSAAPRVIPTPQYMESTPISIQLKRGESIEIQVGSKPARAVAIATELIQKELPAFQFRQASQVKSNGPSIVLWDRTQQGPPPFALSPEAEKILDPNRYFGQSYILETRKPKQIWIVGSSSQGVLYGAATLVQLFESKGNDFEIAGVSIRDYPGFRYRAAADWLLRAELNRWAYDWGDGMSNYVARIERKLDFCTRFKINMVAFDGFGWSPEKRPGYAAMMRKLNAYARERGIKLLYGGYGANFNPRAIEPEFHIGKAHVNRRSYPDGDTYACFGEDRTRLQPTFGTCRSNDALQQEIAGEIESFVRAVEPGALYIHHEDTGHYETTQPRWAARCEVCRRRWPNSDFAAADGGAGAMAHGYSNIFRAVQRVRNADTGYDASKDCTVAFISPAYGVDSQRSGMGSQRIDPELNWRKTLEFWGNAVAQMPQSENLEIGLREIFPSQNGQRWMDAWRETMTARNLRAGVFLFFLGGADQYTNGVFNYPFTGSSVMNGMFDGAETIYNFNGGLHQEPQQVINAEFSWNSNAPGRKTPSDFADGLRLWNAFLSNSEMPEEVIGTGGILHAACSRLYGSEAGTAMSSFFQFHEDRKTTNTLPAFYPQRLYPYVVLWRFLVGDQAYGEKDPTPEERRTIESLNTTRAALQRNISSIWRQNAGVNQRSATYLEKALQATDLRKDAREDVQYLLKCLRAGEQFALLLADHHELLVAPTPELLQKTVARHSALDQWLHREFRFDFTDPKGGDQAAWLDEMEFLRIQLQRFRQ